MTFADRTSVENAYHQAGPTVRAHFLEPLAAALDAVSILTAGIASTYIYQTKGLGVSSSQVDMDSYAALSFIAAVLFIVLSKAVGFYQSFLFSPNLISLKQTLYLWLATVAILGIFAFFLKNGANFSRGTLIIFAFTGALTLGANRVVWRRIVEALIGHNLLFATKVLLIRTTDELADPDDIRHERTLPSDLRGTGFQLTHQMELSLSNIGALRNILPRIRTLIGDREIDEIFIEIRPGHLQHVAEIESHLSVLPVAARLVLDSVTQSIAERPLKKVGSLVVSELQREPLSFVERIAKRILDLAISSSALLLLSPIMLIVAILIKIDSKGSVLFLQDRKGFSGKPFKIFKFRSMSVTENGPTIRQATANDARITKVGRIIRKTSIDELPQLWNVLKGDMSVVGPRPHAVAHDDYYSQLIAAYALRHHTKPGITGLSQVKGFRGETPRLEDMKARIAIDLEYINNWSLLNDVLIIIRTAFVIFRQPRAY